MYARNLALFALAISLILAPTAFAHRLITNDGTHVDAGSALVVAEPNISQLILHEVTDGNEEVWLTFEGAMGDFVYLQLGVPVIDELADYHPVVALIGPGLADTTLPFDIPNGTGAHVFNAGDFEPEFFSEPFTGTESWIYVEETVPLPADGTYYIVGYHPDSTPGKLWVAFGQEEVFGIPDILAYPDTLEEVRAFHEVSGEPLGIIPRIFLIVAAVLRVIGFLF